MSKQSEANRKQLLEMLAAGVRYNARRELPAKRIKRLNLNSRVYSPNGTRERERRMRQMEKNK